MKSGFGRRSALSFSSWFCVPEQGMKDFEILNRASAFLVRALPAAGPAKTKESVKRAPFPAPKVHLVTASHVVAPWRWPKYYPEEWLQCVDQTHTTYTAEHRHDNGVFATQSELKPISYHHPTRDLAVLHFENEDEALELLDEVGVDVLSLAPDDITKLQEGDKLEFHGHEIEMLPSIEADVRKSLPKVSSGFVQGRTPHQIFARTTPVLGQGMCGGPVLRHSTVNKASTESSSGDVYCAGLVEGIVPHDHPTAELQALAVFVESHEIQSFLRDVESGAVEPLVGGQAIAVVSADKDERKMSLEAILEDGAGGEDSTGAGGQKRGGYPSGVSQSNFGGGNFPKG